MTSVAEYTGGMRTIPQLHPQRLREKIGIGMEIPAPDQQDQTLEHRRETHGQHDDEDQRFADQRPKKDPFNQDAEEKTAGEGQKKRQKKWEVLPRR